MKRHAAAAALLEMRRAIGWFGWRLHYFFDSKLSHFFSGLATTATTTTTTIF